MRLLPLIGSALALTACAHGQPAQPPSDLESAFAFFVGSCWDGTFSDRQSTDVQCFRPVYDGTFVRSNHLVEGARGPYGGETIFSWDAEKGVVTYTYWDTSGGTSRGTMIPTDTGLRAPDETYDTPDGSQMVISSRWTITGDDSWQQVVEQVSGDARNTLWTIDYTRAPLSSGPRPELGGN